MWKRYLAFVMTIMLMLLTAPTAVYAGERIDIVQNNSTVAELSEKTENGDETEIPNQTEQTNVEQDSKSELVLQSEDENLIEAIGEVTINNDESNISDSDIGSEGIWQFEDSNTDSNDQAESNQEENEKNKLELDENASIKDDKEISSPIEDTKEQLPETVSTLTSSGENIASGSYQNEQDGSNITWVIDVNGKLAVEGTGEFSNLHGNDRAPWYSYRGDILSAEINVTNIADASYMFYGCINMTNINLENFDSSDVTNMDQMFRGCKRLENIDVSNFDTGKVTSMIGMFSQCNSLTNLDLSGFNTDKVTSMNGMFGQCSSLTNLDLSGFNTSKVTSMGSMFSQCSSLTNLDLSSFDTGKVTNMNYMFMACGLKDLNLSNFDTSKVINMSYMFSECRGLKSIDLSSFDTSEVTDMSYMFETFCDSTAEVWNSNLTSLDLSNFDTSKVANMNRMFYGCNSLTSLDLSNFDISNVTDMSYMFHGCRSLEYLDLSDFDTSNVTDMGSMFSGCLNLTSLNLSGFDTSNVTDMSWMFYQCRNLESLELKSFDTSNVKYIGHMFNDCRNLKCLDLRNIDFSKVIDFEIKSIFSGCTSLLVIYTPINQTCTWSISLPAETDDIWYDSNGNTYVELPKNLSYSIVLCRNEIPVISTPHIILKKEKTTYECGETLSINDLTVTYYNSAGVSSIVNSYTTNANEIDMSTPGVKVLVVTYNDGANTLTEELELTLIEKTEPSKNPVESVKLNMTSLSLEVSETVMLKATVTPDNASDTTITWTSNDTSVAEVENGLVTAISVGKCTITAAAGGKEAVCSVNVSENGSEGIIASGEYKDVLSNITWIIDSNGKLTVEGYGDFAVPSYMSSSSYYENYKNRAPWYEYRDSILSAEINVEDLQDASFMFYGCRNMISVDLANFDTSRISNMYGMFDGCANLKSLDLSKFNTRNLKYMDYMFSYCRSLTDLDLSGFNTSEVRTMRSVFCGCSNLTSLDVSSFDTRNVSNMSWMFAECSALTELNLSGFETKRGVSQYIFEMFEGCSSLISLDLSGFDGASLRDEDPLQDVVEVFRDCDNLNTIYTPYNLEIGYYCLPIRSGDVWYMPDGSEITRLPRSSDSMIITRNKIPTIKNSYITATLRKTEYSVGTSIETVGLIVKYYKNDGNVTIVDDYITNEDEIDMSTAGKKELVVTYNGLRAEVELTVLVIPVESIRLDKDSGGSVKDKNISMLLLDNRGSTNLYATVKPFNATYSKILWSSSDESVAKVMEISNNHVTVSAVASGKCVITASAGEKEAVCNVIVTTSQSQDDIASGAFENIRWKIDVNGKLTVEGIGDFADSNSTNRAPWFEKRSAIKSVEINLTGTTDAAYMFYDCQNLADIDMSRFDVGKVTSFTGFWDRCPKLSTIHVPCHLKESVVLPESDPLYIWCDTEGNTYTELPQNLEHSIVLTRIQKPVTSEPYIALNKEKTSYIVGENLYTDDLEVTYYDETGTPSKVNDYTTNANEIDMSTPGIKTLVVTYQNLTAEIEITVSEQQPEVERGLKISFKNEQDQEVVYTGSAMKPELKVSYNGRPLTEGTNYTVKYSNNVKVGNAKITVTGKGNFKSSKTEYFKIVQADIANAEFAGTDQEGQLVVVQGSKFAPVIYCGNRKLSTNDYSLSGMIQAGKKITDGDSGKVITIKGEGNYIGSKEITLKVVRKNNLTKFTVTLDKTKLNALTYDGRAHYIHEIQGALKVTGKDGNTNMQRGIDYMVVYPANVTDAGTKKISVVGMGLYTGTVSKSYTIKPAVNTSGFVNVEYESGNIERIKLPYRSTGVTFNNQLRVTYTKDGNTLLLREGKDYKVTYSGNKKVGNKAKFTISFLGNYKSLKKQIRMFTIEKADLENAVVVIADAAYKKKPGIYKSVPYLIEPETGRFINASNYKVSYYIDETRNIEMKGKNKVSSGDIVYVKIEAKANGNYRSDSPIVKTYQVANAINLSNMKISFIDAKTECATKTAEYTGNKITDQEIKVLINGKCTDEDVVITYANNIAKGKATVIITGTGKPGCKYTGCKKASFNIVAYSLR